MQSKTSWDKARPQAALSRSTYDHLDHSSRTCRWLGRKNQTRNSWISLSIAGICIAIAFAGLVFIGPRMPLWFVIVMVSLTGIADSFRSVVITPAAQAVLTPEDMGIGTSLIGFFISLSSVISSSLDGIAYDTLRLSEQGVHGITMGVDTVFLISAITGLLTFILSTFIYRKMAETAQKTSKSLNETIDSKLDGFIYPGI